MPRDKKSSRKKSKNKSDSKRSRRSAIRKPGQLCSAAELEMYSDKNNNLLVNAALANAVLHRNIAMNTERADDVMKLHKEVYEMAQKGEFENSELLTLYGIGINDIHKGQGALLKVLDMNEKARIYKDITKHIADIEKAKADEKSNASTTKLVNFMNILLSESMRLNLEDENLQKYLGSNTHKPTEAEDYEVIAIDPNADED